MEEGGSASVGMGAAPSGSGTSAAADVGTEAPAGLRNAPESGTDAGEVAAAGEPSGAAPAEFQILNRRFRDQRHAEEVLGSEINRVRAMQRENAQLQSQHQALQNELASLRALVANYQGQGPRQDVPQGRGDSAGPSEDLDYSLYQKIAEDPEMGLGHAFYALTQDLRKDFQGQMQREVERLKTETIEPITLRNAQAQAVARGMSAAKELAEQFPEIADDNQSPEAEEAQQEILSIFASLPRDWAVQNVRDALWFSVNKYREQHGIPVFAQPPGTSGSPSSLAASAAEAAAHQTAASPIDGSGVPRQRPSGVPESFADRVKRENREVTKVVRTPSGRPLFEAS